MEENIYVELHVELDKVGSVLQIHGHADIFNQEALRIALLLKGLALICKRGELLHNSMFLSFVFTRKKQQQFNSLEELKRQPIRRCILVIGTAHFYGSIRNITQ